MSLIPRSGPKTAAMGKGASVSSTLAKIILRLIGWRAVFCQPPGSKSVIMFYPHTSNWDFPLGVLFKWRYQLDVHWAGKDTLFRFPLGPVLRWLGGVPINRRERTGMVDQLAERFAVSENFHICIAPEGTRSRTEHLKTGFYRLALLAGVPLGLAFVDYRHRCIGIERWVMLSGDEAEDLSVLRDYYASKQAFDPAKAGGISFKSS